jgi:hypothetical protein
MVLPNEKLVLVDKFMRERPKDGVGVEAYFRNISLQAHADVETYPQQQVQLS